MTASSTPNPSGFGQLVSLTTSVAGSIAKGMMPTGSITFYEGSAVLGAGPLAAGTATLAISSLSVGRHTITPHYSGDANFNPQNGTPFVQTVTQASATVTLASSANPSTSGQTVTLTALITPQYGGTATGTISFYDGATLLAGATMGGNNAAFTTSALTVGTHSITAAYGGDANFTGGTSPVLLQTVNGIPIASIAPASLTFPNATVGRTSASQTATVSNTGSSTLSLTTIASSGDFARAASGGTCGTSLPAGLTCTINVVFNPTAAGIRTGSLTVGTSDPVHPSLTVSLSGSGVTPVGSASPRPMSWNFGTVTRGAPIGSLHVFSLTNTGTVTLTGIASPIIALDPTDFTIVALATTCGTINPYARLRQTSLAPGASCAITLQFRPPAGDTAGVKNGILSITDAAGTHTSVLSGRAN